jgi:magnesium transporter
MADSIDTLFTEIHDLIPEKSAEKIQSLCEDAHPADLAQVLRELDEEEALYVFSCLNDEQAAEVLAEADEELSELLTGEIPLEDLSDILEEMEPDDAADVVGDMSDPERVRQVLELMPDLERDEIEGLLAHDEETAGGIMTSEYLAFPETWTVDETIRFLRQAPPEVHFNIAFTLDRLGKLKGVFPVQRLVWTETSKLLRDIADDEVVRVTPDMDQEEVARLFGRYDLVAAPVVDEDGHLTGRITIDDVFDVMQDEHSEDMFKMAGTSDDELVARSARTAFRLRFPWLVVGLSLGWGSALILGGFDSFLAKYSYLTYFLPIVMAMGGNVGTQSSTLIVRGLATGQIESGRFVRIMLREIRIGSLLGVVCGVLAGSISSAIAKLFGHPPQVGIIVGASMTISMVAATLFGSLVPLTFAKLKIDPAIASGPFISTSNDALAVTIYLVVTWRLHTVLIG